MGIADDMAPAEPRPDALATPEAPPVLTMAERLQLELNDDDNAARLLAVHGEDLVYIDGKGWAVWDGTRYSTLKGDAAAQGRASRLRQIVQDEADYAAHSAEIDDEDVEAFMAACEKKRPPVWFQSTDDARQAMRREIAGKLRAHATKCGNLDKQKKALEACAWRRIVDVDDLDRDPFAFVVANGQVDLRKVRDFEVAGRDPEEIVEAKREWLRPVDRAALPTRRGGVAFDPQADCPKWREFLELILPDAEVRACVKRILGATLYGKNRAQACIVLRGPGGNGKSTLLNGLQTVLGNREGYAAPCKIEMFLETGNVSSGGPTPEEINLPGARAYIATEPGARDVLSAKKIKGLTGGDRRMSRGLNKDFFFWTPHGVPILSCNRTPKIKDEDEGTRRRLVFVPFDVNLRALPADKQRDQTAVEAEIALEGPGILNWLLEGFAEFWERGIDMPENMKALKESLLQAADPVGVFLSEMTVRDPAGRLNVTEFYKVLERWCETEGHSLYQMATVRNVMIEKGLESGKYQGRSAWKGITWAPEAAEIVREVLGDHAMPQARGAASPPDDPAPF